MKDKEQDERIAYGIDLWETSSNDFLKQSQFTKKISTKRKFELITWDILDKVVEEKEVEVYYNNKRFDLQIGDLICRKGHVEFYIGDNKVVSWGRVHKAYTINKNFKPLLTGYKSNDKEDKDIPFISFLRFKGGKQ